MRWKIMLEGTDEFGSTHRSELEIDKDLERLSAGEIGFSVEDGKAIMAHLQQVVVNQQCEAYGSGANSRRRKRPVLYCRDFKLGARHSTLQAQVGLGHPDVPVRIVPCGCDASIRYRRS